MYRICLVEDEKSLNDLLKSYMEKSGYEVIQCYDGISALNNINNNIDLWVLDIMLSSDISGYDIIKKIKEVDSKVPVIFTSARDKDLDRIIGLELGSDDYLSKPYSPKELMLRIQNILKRVYSNTQKIRYNNYIIDKDKRCVSIFDKQINLTSLEFDLLVLFIDNIGKSFKRDEILSKVWGSDYFGNDRVVDDLVRRLRSKMKDLNINTIYGFGYRLS